MKEGHRIGTCVVLAAIFVFGLLLRMHGMARPTALHPDERTILRWMEHTRSRGWLEHTYAGGYFTLAEQTRRWLEILIFRPREWLRRWRGETDRAAVILEVSDFARPFNVGLGAATIFLIYGLCRAVGAGRPASLLGALLFAGAAYPIEHSHYIESDTAAVAALTLALILWARHRAKPNFAGFVLAAWATGFATGTKYPLAVLIPLVFVAAVESAAAQSLSALGRIKRFLGRAFVGCLITATGFLTASPAPIKMRGFFQQLRMHGRRVASETAGILGAAHAEPWARQAWHGRELLHFFGSMGIGWIAMAVIGLALQALPRRRRPWPVLILYPAFFLYYWFFSAPFVRTQEFMLFMPAFAAAASLAADALMRYTLRPCHHVAIGVALLTLALPTIRLGMIASDRCGWSDTRWMARDWMARTLPSEAVVAFETYTPPGGERMPFMVQRAGTVEENGVEYFSEIECDYIIRNASYLGRGLRNPFNGQRYPNLQTRLDAVRRVSAPLRSWAPLEPVQPRVTFRSPAIEMWAFNAPSKGPRIPIPVPRPSFIGEGGRETFSPIGEELGAAEIIQVTRYEREIAISGPLPRRAIIFVLLETEEREAEIRVCGLGRRRIVSLAAYDAAVVALRRPAWLPRFLAYERVRLSARPQRFIVHIPCWARLTTDPIVAADFLLERGRAREAWALLREHDSIDRAPELSFRCATAAGDLGAASALADVASAQRRLLEHLLDRPHANWQINGIPFAQIERLARIRIVAPPKRPLCVELKPTEKEPGIAEARAETVFPLPIRSACPLSLTMDVRVRWPDLADTEDTIELLDSEGRRWHVFCRSASCQVDLTRVQLELPGGARERDIHLRWRASTHTIVEIHRAEVTWDPRRALAAWIRRPLLVFNSIATEKMPIFEPFLAIRGVERVESDLHIHLEVLRQDLPPLVVVLQQRRLWRWRVVQRLALIRKEDDNANRRLIVVPEHLLKRNTFLSITADVAVRPGALRIQGATRIPLSLVEERFSKISNENPVVAPAHTEMSGSSGGNGGNP